MTDVFISYSRRDGPFVHGLHDFLAGAGRDVWVDWEDIPPASQWERDIGESIDGAESFVFVVSASSLASQYCTMELGRAQADGKRVVPIACEQVDPGTAPPALRQLNWIWCRDTDDRDAAFDKLTQALDTDLEWARAHTRLLVRAVEWDARRDPSLLLRGRDLEEGAGLLAANTGNNPAPTALQQEYVLASRRAAARRQRILLGSVTLALVLALVLAGLAWLQRSSAIRAKNSASSLALSSAANDQLGGRPDVSLLLGLEAYRAKPSAQAEHSLISALQAARRSDVAAILHGHTDPLTSVAFSPHGRTLATADSSGAVRLWDLRAHTQLGVLRGQTHPVSSVAFSPDGATLVTATDNGTVWLWDVSARAPIGPPLRVPVDPFGNSPVAVAFGTDGRALAALPSISTERLWDVRARTQIGRPVRSPETDALELSGVAFSENGNWLATASWEGVARLWDVRANRQIGQWGIGHPGTITGVAVSPDGKTLATANTYGAVRLWDVRTHEQLGPPLRGHTRAVERMSFSPGGRVLATAGADGTVRLWDVRTHAPLGEPLRGHTGTVTALVFGPGGRTLAAAGADRTVWLWDVRAHRPLGHKLPGAVGFAGPRPFGGAVAFSPDGRTLAAAGSDRSVRLWDIRTQRGRLLAGTRPPVPVCKPLPSGGVCVSTGIAAVSLPEGAGWPVGVGFSADGRTLVTAGDGGWVRVWSVQGHRPFGRPLRTGAELATVAVGPDGRTVAVAGLGKTVRFWDPATRKPLGRLLGRPGTVYAAAFSPDGHMLATAGADGTVRLWDARTRKLLGRPLRGHPKAVSSVAFSRDGRTLATGSADATVRLWNLHSRKQLGQPLLGHVGTVNGVAFSPDGRTLASAGADRTARLWDVRTHTRLGRPLGHTAEVWSVAFSPDGRSLATAGADRRVRLWEGILWRDRADLTAEVCGLVVGNLTPAEWAVLAPGLPYRSTCPA